MEEKLWVMLRRKEVGFDGGGGGGCGEWDEELPKGEGGWRGWVGFRQLYYKSQEDGELVKVPSAQAWVYPHHLPHPARISI